jgi:NACHT domain-containing protein/CHAT domain-containing protein
LLSFQAQDGDGGNDVPGSTVASLLKKFNIPMVVLNACSSAYETGQDNSSIGSILAMSGISYVIAMRYDIPIASAATAVQTLYLTLLSKGPTSGLIAVIRKRIFQDQSLGRFHGFSYLKLDWLLPIAYVGEHPSPAYFTTVQPNLLDQETISRSAFVKSLEFDTYPAIRGREIDVLQIETILSMQPDSKTVLIHGLSGVGKTTLLRHLSWWWAATGLITKVLWLDMAQCNRSIPEMMAHLTTLLTKTSNSHCLTVPGFKESLSKTLSPERYMVVFENMDTAQKMLQQNQDDPDTQTFTELCRGLCADAAITLIEQRTPHLRMLGMSYHSHHLLGINKTEILQLASIQVSQVGQNSVKSSDIVRLAQHCNGLPGVVEELGQSLLSSPTDLDMFLSSFDPWHHPEKLNTAQTLLANISFAGKGRAVALTAEERQILSCFTLLKRFVRKIDLRRYIQVRTQMTPQQPAIDATVLEQLLERLLLSGLVTDCTEEQSFSTEQKSDLLELHPLLSVRLRQEVEEVADESSKELAFVEVFCEEARSYSNLLAKAHEQRQQTIFVHAQVQRR